MKLLSSFILVSSLAFASPQDYGFLYNLQNSIKGNDSVLVGVEINSFTSKVAEVVLPSFAAHTNNQAIHLTVEQTQKINDSAEAIQLFGPRISLIEASTNHWNTAYSWGDHSMAGYLLPADLLPYATVQQVTEAVQQVTEAVSSLNLYAVPVDGGKHELWAKE